MTDFGNLDDGLEEFARKTLARADQIKRAVGIKLFGAVIDSTPVGNPDLWKGRAPAGYVGGRLRANWRCTIGSASNTSTPSTAHAEAKPAMEGVLLSQSDRNTVDFLTNNLSYAERIEYDGHSGQAPSGMVRINVARFRRLLSQSRREAR